MIWTHFICAHGTAYTVHVTAHDLVRSITFRDSYTTLAHDDYLVWTTAHGMITQRHHRTGTRNVAMNQSEAGLWGCSMPTQDTSTTPMMRNQRRIGAKSWRKSLTDRGPPKQYVHEFARWTTVARTGERFVLEITKGSERIVGVSETSIDLDHDSLVIRRVII